MNYLNRSLFAFVLAVAASAVAADTATTAAFVACKAEAEVEYGNAELVARVRLDDVRKSGREMRLRVFTPEGRSLTALCEVDRQSGQLVSLQPRRTQAIEPQVAARRD